MRRYEIDYTTALRELIHLLSGPDVERVTASVLATGERGAVQQWTFARGTRSIAIETTPADRMASLTDFSGRFMRDVALALDKADDQGLRFLGAETATYAP